MAYHKSEQCDMGVGCDEYGACYAEAQGRPEMCPLRDKFDYPTFTAKIVEFLLDEKSSADMLKWYQEMDNDPHDLFFEELTKQLRERHPEEWEG